MMRTSHYIMVQRIEIFQSNKFNKNIRSDSSMKYCIDLKHSHSIGYNRQVNREKSEKGTQQIQ